MIYRGSYVRAETYDDPKYVFEGKVVELKLCGTGTISYWIDNPISDTLTSLNSRRYNVEEIPDPRLG